MVSDTAMLSGRRRRRGGRNEEWMVEGWKERGKEGEGGRKEALRGVVDVMVPWRCRWKEVTRGQEPKNGWEKDRMEKGGAIALVDYYGGVVVVRLEGVDEAAGTPKMDGGWMNRRGKERERVSWES